MQGLRQEHSCWQTTSFGISQIRIEGGRIIGSAFISEMSGEPIIATLFSQSVGQSIIIVEFFDQNK